MKCIEFKFSKIQEKKGRFKLMVWDPKSEVFSFI